ncbi:hypothetical protein CFOL_v3_30908 [Cephalotus follicularis]|uniref:Uncharacterized protein n=1 Tax=Cephalotus follicularis TaxID=3775 RepID=A0A1Q3D4V3_CEPFO|nr:hypothetical protein CFOL_v3_30908 [Cephalotus follicularis]
MEISTRSVDFRTEPVPTGRVFFFFLEKRVRIGFRFYFQNLLRMQVGYGYKIIPTESDPYIEQNTIIPLMLLILPIVPFQFQNKYSQNERSTQHQVPLSIYVDCLSCYLCHHRHRRRQHLTGNLNISRSHQPPTTGVGVNGSCSKLE